MKVVMIKRVIKVGMELVSLILLIKQEITILISGLIATILLLQLYVTIVLPISIASLVLKQLTTTQLFKQLIISLISYFVTSLVKNKEQQINKVSINLQVETPHFAVSSFQIRIIANTARHIAYIANCNLSSFISLFIFDYYLYNCVQYQQHEHLEKINKKPEHHVARLLYFNRISQTFNHYIRISQTF